MSSRFHFIRSVWFAVSLLAPICGLAIPAFPGAEGAGANATGGRGGSIYFVTNLNDSGAGSLRTGVGTGNRTIIFKVSGTIDLLTDLNISKNNLTIAGQTAPGDGITLQRRITSVQNCSNVIVRYLRCRPGDLDSTFQNDSCHVVNGTNIVVDHVSASWSVDECLSVTWSTNVSIQWCMISESLKNSQHDKGSHGYGTLLRYGYGQLSFHHNLYQHHDSRNPRLGDNLKLDFVNNLIYDWGGTAGYSGTYDNDIVDSPQGFTNHLNYLSNYLVAGPSTSSSSTAFRGYATNTVIYHLGNRIDSDKDAQLDGIEAGNAMIAGTYTASATRYPLLSSVNADPAPLAYQRVLAFVGASQFRDETDSRLINTVRTRTGRLIDAVGTNTQTGDYLTNNINGTNYVFVRGWPALNSATPPADTDNDGIPNYWEVALGWNASVTNHNHVNLDGYTDLEWYLNWLAAAHTVCDRNGSVDLNLRKFIGGYTNASFALAASTNGGATILPDGYTARFTATNNFSGLAQFTFTASNTVDAATLGSIAVSVLVSTTNAPVAINTPPALAAIANATLIAGATLAFTASATDTNLPVQTLTFSGQDFPTNASVNSSNGQFVWRPRLAQSPTTNSLKLVVTDNGSPNLSATQAFTVTVNSPVRPGQSALLTNGQFQLTVSGDVGPDYTVQSSSNLTSWTNVFTTNSPPLPFIWRRGLTNFSPGFFRIQLAP